MAKFKVGDSVRVKETAKGTKRTPSYVRGKAGRVLFARGVIEDYEHDHEDFRGPMYGIIFDCKELFGKSLNEKVVVDLHEQWLESRNK